MTSPRRAASFASTARPDSSRSRAWSRRILRVISHAIPYSAGRPPPAIGGGQAGAVSGEAKGPQRGVCVLGRSHRDESHNRVFDQLDLESSFDCVFDEGEVRGLGGGIREGSQLGDDLTVESEPDGQPNPVSLGLTVAPDENLLLNYSGRLQAPDGLV